MLTLFKTRNITNPRASSLKCGISMFINHRDLSRHTKLSSKWACVLPVRDHLAEAAILSNSSFLDTAKDVTSPAEALVSSLIIQLVSVLFDL